MFKLKFYISPLFLLSPNSPKPKDIYFGIVFVLLFFAAIVCYRLIANNINVFYDYELSQLKYFFNRR